MLKEVVGEIKQNLRGKKTEYVEKIKKNLEKNKSILGKILSKIIQVHLNKLECREKVNSFF